MSKSKSNSFDKRLNRKITAVWLYQKEHRMLLNFFDSYEMARKYVNAFKHMKVDGEFLIGECSLADLIKQ